MNGFETKGLGEDVFGEKPSLSGLKTFDAFREFKPDCSVSLSLSLFSSIHSIEPLR